MITINSSHLEKKIEDVYQIKLGQEYKTLFQIK